MQTDPPKTNWKPASDSVAASHAGNDMLHCALMSVLRWESNQYMYVSVCLHTATLWEKGARTKNF
jgi:hypothetical protein